MTDEILHVHHWHKRKINCFDTKTTKEEDLPFIECCCRCNQEREIPVNLNVNMNVGGEKLLNYIQKSGDFPDHELANNIEKESKSFRRDMTLDRLRKLEQKREFEGAAATLKAYHERKKRKAENNTEH